ncbi:MAG: alkaline phosphatase family protein [Thermoanaerobaculia bacterium]
MTGRRLCIAFLSVLVAASLVAAPQPQPDLIVLISIDQFPDRYLRRFQPYFSEGGFNRLMRRGADFTHALYPYATTFTGPGHAALGTGQVPSRSGIVSNTWFDRLDGAPEYCVSDTRAGGFSPLNLASDSLGDRLQEKYPGAKVFGVSLKDRAAILMAGRKATAAYWWDWNAGGFTSSAYYRSSKTLTSDFDKVIPDIVRAHPTWEPSGFIPAPDLARLTHDPESLRKYKQLKESLGLSFPHPIKSAEALTYTPFGNDLVIGFAEMLIDEEKIGTSDGQPDILFVSLSSTDYLGHVFGPDSLEMADSIVRIDRQLEKFLADLDTRFGDRYTVALSADHGIQSIPEVARDMGRDAGRIAMRNPGANVRTFGELAPQRLELEKLAAAKLGLKVTNDTPLEKTLILFFEEPGLYLNWVRIREAGLDGERVKRAIRDAAKQIKGVSNAFTNSELMTLNRDASDLERAVRNSFRADRSGDVLITLRAGYIWDYSGTGTTHGQPVEDDQHVPVLLWGRGITPGTYDDHVAPTDLARTLGTLVGVEVGGPQSIVLPCVHP